MIMYTVFNTPAYCLHLFISKHGHFNALLISGSGHIHVDNRSPSQNRCENEPPQYKERMI